MKERRGNVTEEGSYEPVRGLAAVTVWDTDTSSCRPDRDLDDIGSRNVLDAQCAAAVAIDAACAT